MVSVAIDWTLIAQLITFLILMFVLNRILFKPILAILREREDIYEGLKRKAQDSKSQLEEGEAEEKSSRAGALAEGARLQGILRGEGQKKESEVLAAAQEEAAGNLEKARGALRDDVFRARKELEMEAAVLAREMAAKILKRDLPLSG
ncbi:MAG: ATP synthase F0 subunit B [Deltaproteobacteria bacterium]|nr:ATP synthase F0 subunit B [Deltaproteobacteria bacterium]